MIGGLGSGSNSVASMAMVIADAKKEEREKHIGLIETTTGIGFLIGPVWGSLMYQVGGYPAPFACSGKSFLFKPNSSFSTFVCGLLANCHLQPHESEIEAAREAITGYSQFAFCEIVKVC